MSKVPDALLFWTYDHNIQSNAVLSQPLTLGAACVLRFIMVLRQDTIASPGLENWLGLAICVIIFEEKISKLINDLRHRRTNRPWRSGFEKSIFGCLVARTIGLRSDWLLASLRGVLDWYQIDDEWIRKAENAVHYIPYFCLHVTVEDGWENICYLLVVWEACIIRDEGSCTIFEKNKK